MVIARDDSKAAIRAADHAEVGKCRKPCLPLPPRWHARARRWSTSALTGADLNWGILALAGSFRLSMQVSLSIAQCLLSRLRVRPSSMLQHRRRPPSDTRTSRCQDHPGRILCRSEPLTRKICKRSDRMVNGRPLLHHTQGRATTREWPGASPSDRRVAPASREAYKSGSRPSSFSCSYVSHGRCVASWPILTDLSA